MSDNADENNGTNSQVNPMIGQQRLQEQRISTRLYVVLLHSELNIKNSFDPLSLFCSYFARANYIHTSQSTNKICHSKSTVA